MGSLRADFQLIPPSILFTELSTCVYTVLIQKNSKIFILEINLVLREPTRSENSIKTALVLWFSHGP